MDKVLDEKMNRIRATAKAYQETEKKLNQEMGKLEEWAKTIYHASNQPLQKKDPDLQDYEQKISRIGNLLQEDLLVSEDQKRSVAELKINKKPLLQLEIVTVPKYQYPTKVLRGSIAILRGLMYFEYRINLCLLQKGLLPVDNALRLCLELYVSPLRFNQILKVTLRRFMLAARTYLGKNFKQQRDRYGNIIPFAEDYLTLRTEGLKKLPEHKFEYGKPEILQFLFQEIVDTQPGSHDTMLEKLVKAVDHAARARKCHSAYTKDHFFKRHGRVGNIIDNLLNGLIETSAVASPFNDGTFMYYFKVHPAAPTLLPTYLTRAQFEEFIAFFENDNIHFLRKLSLAKEWKWDLAPFKKIATAPELETCRLPEDVNGIVLDYMYGPTVFFKQPSSTASSSTDSVAKEPQKGHSLS